MSEKQWVDNKRFDTVNAFEIPSSNIKSIVAALQEVIDAESRGEWKNLRISLEDHPKYNTDYKYKGVRRIFFIGTRLESDAEYAERQEQTKYRRRLYEQLKTEFEPPTKD